MGERDVEGLQLDKNNKRDLFQMELLQEKAN